EGAWVRRDGAIVARDHDTLVHGPLEAPLQLDERGRNVGDVIVATGTDSDGGLDIFKSNCADWTASAGKLQIGGAAMVDDKWTNGVVNFDMGPGDEGCSVPMHVYCLGSGQKIDVGPPPARGAVAFVTEGEYSG